MILCMAVSCFNLIWKFLFYNKMNTRELLRSLWLLVLWMRIVLLTMLLIGNPNRGNEVLSSALDRVKVLESTDPLKASKTFELLFSFQSTLCFLNDLVQLSKKKSNKWRIRTKRLKISCNLSLSWKTAKTNNFHWAIRNLLS